MRSPTPSARRSSKQAGRSPKRLPPTHPPTSSAGRRGADPVLSPRQRRAGGEVQRIDGALDGTDLLTQQSEKVLDPLGRQLGAGGVDRYRRGDIPPLGQDGQGQGGDAGHQASRIE